MIRTVLGDIPGSALGHAQCHEHLLVAETPASLAAPALLIDDKEKSVRELAAFRKAGGGAVVDAQPVCAGRMPRGLVDASLRTGVHVITVTGFHKRMFYRADCPLLSMASEALAELYCADITTGMLTDALDERISARAGVVKIAFDAEDPQGLRPDWTEAALEAARLTGAPILVHTEPDCDASALLDLALTAGIPAPKLIFCHMDRTCRDADIHRALAEAGAYLCYDSIHRFKYISTVDELALISAMLEAGLEDQMLLSLDVTRARLKSYGGDVGLDCILTEFSGEMRSAGIDEAIIYKLTNLNAANALQIDR